MNNSNEPRVRQAAASAAYDRERFMQNMQQYSNNISAASWLLSGPTSYFVVEPEPVYKEPTV